MRSTAVAAATAIAALALVPAVAASPAARKPTSSELAGIRSGLRTWWCARAHGSGPCSSWKFTWGATVVATQPQGWALTAYRPRQTNHAPQQGGQAVLRRGRGKWKVVTSFTELEGETCAVASRQIQIPEPVAKDLGICRDLPSP